MFKTIQGKYTAVIILIVTLFLGGLLGINYLLLRSHAFSSAAETAWMLLDHADQQVNMVFRDIEAMLETLSQQDEVKKVEVDRMHNLFVSNVHARDEYIRAIYLGTADGHMYEWGVGPGFVDNTPTFPEGYDPRERPWYEKGLQVNGYALTSPYIYASVHALGITAVRPVYESGELVGILGIDLIINGLQNLVNALKIQQGVKIMLLDNEQQILVNQFDPNPMLTKDLKHFSTPELLENDQTSKVIVVDGKRFLLSHKINEATGWKMLLFVPYDEILAFSQQNLKIILSFDILLMLLLGIVITFISRRLLTRPLDEIITVMRHREQGKALEHIPDQSGSEFKLIARLFNRLSDISHASSKRMEEQVKKRTEDVIRLQKENMRLRIIEEKERLFSNIHDSLGARLTGINISNNVAKHALERNEVSIIREMHDRIEKNTRQGINDLREILLTKDADILTGDDFILFIEEQLPERLSIKQIDLSCTMPDDVFFEGLRSDLLSGMKRVIQEMVTNTLKHSHASHVSLQIAVKNSRLSVSFSDDGRGFDLKEAEKKGFGLQGLHGRVERLGGYLRITTKPGKGTRYDIQFKLEGGK